MRKLAAALALAMAASVFFPASAVAGDGALLGGARENLGLVQSEAVLVMDAATGEVLYEVNGFARMYPASVTKVMTALLVLENVGGLDETVVFSRDAVDLPSYAARLWLSEGERFPVRDLMYGLMLSSGNEVARALAEHVSGSVDAFVEKMNARAAELGALSTRFVNPCGLPGDGQFVTAYDVALIMRAALAFPFFEEVISTDYYEFPPFIAQPEGRLIHNTHRMIRRTLGDDFDPRVVGGKTGFTFAARNTLVSLARHDGFELIISTLGAPSRGTFGDTRLLMDYSFALLALERAGEVGESWQAEAGPERTETEETGETPDTDTETKIEAEPEEPEFETESGGEAGTGQPEPESGGQTLVSGAGPPPPPQLEGQRPGWSGEPVAPPAGPATDGPRDPDAAAAALSTLALALLCVGAIRFLYREL